MDYDLRQKLGVRGYDKLNMEKVVVVRADAFTHGGDSYSALEGGEADNYKNLVGMVGTVKGSIFHFKKEDQDAAGKEKWDKLYKYGIYYTRSNLAVFSPINLLTSDNENNLKLDLDQLSRTTLNIIGRLESGPTPEQRRALAEELLSSGMHQTPSGGGKRRKKSKKRCKSKRKSKRRSSTKRKSKRR